MPADREAPSAASPALPDVVTDASNDVGFIDVAGLDPSTIPATIDRAFRSLAVGAVIAVHGVAEADLDSICDRFGLELISTIRHASGTTTSTIRRQPTAADAHTAPVDPP